MMTKQFLSNLALLSIIFNSCSEVKNDKLEETVHQEEKTVLQPEVEKAPEIKPLPTPKVDTLRIDGTLVKFSNTSVEGETRVIINVDGDGEEMEFNYPTGANEESIQAMANNKVQVTYYNQVINSEFDIHVDGITIHEMSEFEPTEDAPFKWSKVDGVLSVNTLSNGIPKPITITSKDGSQTIINSYVHQSHLDNNGKEVTAYYGEERQYNAISFSLIEQVTYQRSFLGVWGTTNRIIIADGGADGYYMSFGQDSYLVEADVNSNTIEGSNFTGKFTIKLISTDPPQFLYSDDGRGHFEPVVDQLYEKVVSDNAKLLVGKWQSTDDPKSIIEYTQYDLINYYNEKLMVKEPYCLSPKCMNGSEANSDVSSKHDYISVINSDMCWYIVSIDETNLTLSYTGSGNTLEYKRVK